MSARWYVRESVPGSSKSGAGFPTSTVAMASAYCPHLKAGMNEASVLLERDRVDHDGLAGRPGVAAGVAELGDAVDHVHPVGDLAEDRELGWQAGVRGIND